MIMIIPAIWVNIWTKVDYDDVQMAVVLFRSLCLLLQLLLAESRSSRMAFQVLIFAVGQVLMR